MIKRNNEDRMPTIGEYRGVPIHAFQSQQRIVEIVHPAIDGVFAMTNETELFDYAGDQKNPPEARLLAAARIEAIYDDTVHRRMPRSGIDLGRLKAIVAGLDSLTWADPDVYGTLLDPFRDGVAPERPPEFRDELKRAMANLAA